MLVIIKIMGRLNDFLLSCDQHGYNPTLKFKGSDKHHSKMGAFVSIAIRVLVATYLILRLISMAAMTDPTITVFQRPLYLSESEGLGHISLNDYQMNIGVVVSGADGGPLTIPAEVGRMMAVSTTSGSKEPTTTTYLPLVSCQDVFHQNEE
jgi:hypothetical protein